MERRAMEVEIRVPCAEGVKHAVRVRVFHSLLRTLSDYYAGMVDILREL
jgi:hypothetical protein